MTINAFRELARVVPFSLQWSAALLLLGPTLVGGQSTTTKAAAPEASSAPGFSIESEMITYRALESNSDAIACEVASVLGGVPIHFTKDTPGGFCDVAVGKPQIKVVILPFDNHIVSDFALWRADMQTMREIVDHASAAIKMTNGVVSCSKPSGDQNSQTHTKGASGGGGLLPEVSPQLAAVSSILALFASDSSVSPVGGTIEDQAFMDDVSRDLRVLKVNVLSPSLYLPTTLAPIDEVHSPFLALHGQLVTVHDCLLEKDKDDPSVAAIEKFLNSLSDSLPAGSGASNSGNAPQANGGTGGKGVATSGSDGAAGQPRSHLSAVLSADALAHSLGVGQDGTLGDHENVHLLELKALESGGEVSRLTNILGTRISYSGGSVGTYALFSLDGQIECSGNVYDYAGPVASKNFERNLRAFAPDPSAQVMFKRGYCPALTAGSLPANPK